MTIHGADFSLVEQHGLLRDPFGTFQIDAKFTATANQRFMTQTMDDLNQAIGKPIPSTQP